MTRCWPVQHASQTPVRPARRRRYTCPTDSPCHQRTTARPRCTTTVWKSLLQRPPAPPLLFLSFRTDGVRPMPSRNCNFLRVACDALGRAAGTGHLVDSSCTYYKVAYGWHVCNYETCPMRDCAKCARCDCPRAIVLQHLRHSDRPICNKGRHPISARYRERQISGSVRTNAGAPTPHRPPLPWPLNGSNTRGRSNSRHNASLGASCSPQRKMTLGPGPREPA